MKTIFNKTSDLSKQLDGKSYLSIAAPMIKSGLESSNWTQCYSALQTFIQIIKYIKEIPGWNIPSIDENENDESKKDNNNNCIWNMFMNIINNNKLESILRGKAMECIGMIGESVGIIKFNKDTHKLMNVFVYLNCICFVKYYYVLLCVILCRFYFKFICFAQICVCKQILILFS